jgi:hypothetical protein
MKNTQGQTNNNQNENFKNITNTNTELKFGYGGETVYKVGFSNTEITNEQLEAKFGKANTNGEWVFSYGENVFIISESEKGTYSFWLKENPSSNYEVNNEVYKNGTRVFSNTYSKVTVY